MIGTKKSPLHRSAKNGTAGPKVPSKVSSNPFDSDDKLDDSKGLTSSGKVPVSLQNSGANPFDDGDDNGGKGAASSASQFGSSYAQRSRYKNGFRESGGLESQSVEELENYAVYKSEETTVTVNNCLKIASEMREDATKTLITLHQQGEQITRTHETIAGIDHDLSRGEKLLGSLGGIFSKTWKPMKTRPVAGPVYIRDDPATRSGAHLAQREKLGLAAAPDRQSRSRTPPSEPTNALQKVEVEKAKQDDSLSQLSDMLGELKEMAIDMGSEIEWQSKALDGLDDDVSVVNPRLKYANNRAHGLLRK
ncbi:Helical region found in SNAREs [Dionaea muscipula]